MQPLVQSEFHVSDAQIGLLTTAFFLCYMVASPATGWLADRYSRRNLVIAGAFIWSAATLLTALTRDFTIMLVRHTIVGIGEATFVAIAPAYIADLFPEKRRGRMLSLFYLAIPMGVALGYIIGGALGSRFGWRMPFYVCAAPGVLVAVLLFFVKDPVRGIYDTIKITPERVSLRLLGKNPAFITATLGMAMYTFGLGAISVWMPTFLHRDRGMSLASREFSVRHHQPDQRTGRNHHRRVVGRRLVEAGSPRLLFAVGMEHGAVLSRRPYSRSMGRAGSCSPLSPSPSS